MLPLSTFLSYLFCCVPLRVPRLVSRSCSTCPHLLSGTMHRVARRLRPWSIHGSRASLPTRTLARLDSTGIPLLFQAPSHLLAEHIPFSSGLKLSIKLCKRQSDGHTLLGKGYTAIEAISGARPRPSTLRNRTSDFVLRYHSAPLWHTVH